MQLLQKCIGRNNWNIHKGEQITGSATGAKARIIIRVPMSCKEGGFGATDFTTSDTITGTSSGATANI